MGYVVWGEGGWKYTALKTAPQILFFYQASPQVRSRSVHGNPNPQCDSVRACTTTRAKDEDQDGRRAVWQGAEREAREKTRRRLSHRTDRKSPDRVHQIRSIFFVPQYPSDAPFPQARKTFLATDISPLSSCILCQSRSRAHPTEENPDSDAVKCASLALDALTDVTEASKSTWPDLWPRIWAWIFFFKAYCQCLVEPFAQPFACLDLVGFVGSFNRDKTAKLLISQTVGLRTVVMEAWVVILASKERQEHWAFGDLCSVLLDMSINPDIPRDFEEILDGAKGAASLGHLIVESIKLLLNLGQDQPSVSERNLAFLTAILRFLENWDNRETFSPAVIQNGGATFITMAAAAPCNVDFESGEIDRDFALQKVALLCFSALYSLLSYRRAMCEALEAGLLPLVLYGATIPPCEMRGLRLILTQTLPASTVFQTVLEELEDRLQNVRHIGENVEFEGCWMHKEWLAFTALADDRIAFMKTIRSKDSILSKACDNTERIDWRAGGHREVCNSLRISSFNLSSLPRFNLN
ncbi:hypothetical protein C8R45DRAFT_1084189 [Mycena sanguinolenta]|nr:hypothetical protein C8R45DRAFT_1084189 [Mycena sanguinolenta]